MVALRKSLFGLHSGGFRRISLQTIENGLKLKCQAIDLHLGGMSCAIGHHWLVSHSERGGFTNSGLLHPEKSAPILFL
jgi:hypothetical protein